MKNTTEKNGVELYQPTAADLEAMRNHTGHVPCKIGRSYRGGWEARTTIGLMDFHTFKSQSKSIICTMHRLEEIKHGQDSTVAVWDVTGQPSEIMFQVTGRATQGLIEFCHKQGVLAWVERCKRADKLEVSA
jgi:hypothetical protein